MHKKCIHYKSASLFITENIDLYIAIHANGLRKEFIEITGWRDIVPWSKISETDTRRVLIASVFGYQGAKIFEKEQAGKYAKAQELDVWHEMMEAAGWTVPKKWSSMSDHEAKECIINAARNYFDVNTFQKKGNRYYKKAIELGCLVEVSSHMTSGKLPFAELTHKEQKAIALEAASAAKDVRRFSSNHQEKYHYLRDQGLLSEAFKHLNYAPRETKLDLDLIGAAKRLAPLSPDAAKTIAELVAYGILKLKESELDDLMSYIKHEYIGCLMSLLGHPIRSADLAWLEKQIPHRSTRNAITRFILEPILSKGALLNPNLFSYAKNSSRWKAARNHFKKLNISTERTILESALEVWNETGYLSPISFDFAWENKERKLFDIDINFLESWISDGGPTRNVLGRIRKAIKDELLAPFAENGWMDNIYANNTEKKQKLINDALDGDNENVFYHIAKFHKKNAANKKLHLAHLIRAKELFDTRKPKDFSTKDYNIDNIASVKIKQVYRLMVKERVAPSGILDKRDEGYVFDDDIWLVNGQKLDFTLITTQDFRHVIKTYYDKCFLLETKSSDVKPHIYTAKKLEQTLKDLGILTWKDFTNLSKQRFYDKCSEMKMAGKSSKVRQMVLLARALIKKVKPLSPQLFDREVVIHDGEYHVKTTSRSTMVLLKDEDMEAILTYIKKDIGKQSKDRLIDIAAVLQLVTFRRVSEIAAMKTDTLRLLGSTSEKILVYHSEKKKKMETVSLASLKGERRDPFALYMEELIPSLLDEAVKISRAHRKVAGDNLKDCLFLEESTAPGKKGLYHPIAKNAISNRITVLRKELGLPKGFIAHQARHTGATRLIRAGSNLSQVAAALGDSTKTTEKSYIDTVTQRETMSTERGVLITTIEDTVKEIILTKYPGEPKPMTDEQADKLKEGIEVVGGRCMAGASECFSCKSFRQTSGNSGCKGCAMYTPTTGQLPYWKLKHQKSSMNLQRYRGTEFSDHLLHEHQRDENILKRLMELTDEYS
ncbi:tyrosine-type recombinase/integrase [Campylobacterota bacterium]